MTTSPRSQKEQHRDLSLFLTFMEQEFGSTSRLSWLPWVARDFLAALQNTFKGDGSRKWSDRTINRMTAHLKTFAKWIHQHRPFPLGQPMEKIEMLSVGNQLEIERALTKQERNRILDAADQLLISSCSLVVASGTVIATVVQLHPREKTLGLTGIEPSSTPLLKPGCDGVR